MPDIEFLKKHAVWIVVDPWEKHPFPNDLKRCPDINKHNIAVIAEIAKVLPELHYAVTSCPQIYPVHPLLQHLPNIYHYDRFLFNYINKYSIKDVVYLGFHHGRCILGSPIGAIALHKLKTYNLYLKRDLTGTLSYDDPLVMDQKSKNYLTFI